MCALDGEETRGAAGGDDDVGGGIGFVAHGYGMCVDEACLAADEGDAGSLHQAVDGTLKLADDGILAGHGFRKVEADVGCGDAEGFGVAAFGQHLGGVAQAFGGDASGIQAGTAQGITFDDDGLQAGGCGMYSGFVATGAGADDDELGFHDVGSREGFLEYITVRSFRGTR